MNKNEAINIICKNFCRFYKPEKDEALACRGFDLILNLVGEKKINEARISEITDFTLSAYPFDELLKEYLCKKCEFVIDGCAFREDPHPSLPLSKGEGEGEGGGEKKIPCGGYILLTKLLRRGVLETEDIR